jgi:hypothetical protein
MRWRSRRGGGVKVAGFGVLEPGFADGAVPVREREPG